MRTKCRAAVLTLALAGGLLLVRHRAGAVSDPPTPEAAWTVEGYGDGADEAADVAFRKAAARIREYLDGRYGDLGWTPSADDLRSADVIRGQERTTVTTHVDGEARRYEKVTLRVDVTPRQAEQLRRMAWRDRAAQEKETRTERTFQRQRWAGLGLVGAVALLVGGAAASLRLRRRDTGARS